MVDLTTRPILVTGATGKTGRRIRERLLRRGLTVRDGARRAAIPFDWADEGGWSAALSGVDLVYVAYQPDIALPRALETLTAFFNAAREAEVSRAVLLSGRGEPEAEAAEKALFASGLGGTVLRASWFAQNFSEGVFRDDVMAGEVVLPAGDVVEPFVDLDDLADAAVTTLLDGRHDGCIYELTGRVALTFREAVAQISAVVGRPIGYTNVPLAAWRAGALAAGTPAEFVELASYLFATVLDGRNSHTTEDFARLLGRPPRSFADYARDAAAAGAWQAP